MTTDGGENWQLRLEQLSEQATALMDAVASLGPYSPTAPAPAWLRGLVSHLAAEVTRLIPEERYFPDTDASGCRFKDTADVSAHMENMLDIRLLLSLVLAATGRYSRPAVGYRP